MMTSKVFEDDAPHLILLTTSIPMHITFRNSTHSKFNRMLQFLFFLFYTQLFIRDSFFIFPLSLKQHMWIKFISIITNMLSANSTETKTPHNF